MRQGGEAKEIEITPQMIEAGLQALFEFRGEGDVLLVTEILRAALRQQQEVTELRRT